MVVGFQIDKQLIVQTNQETLRGALTSVSGYFGNVYRRSDAEKRKDGDYNTDEGVETAEGQRFPLHGPANVYDPITRDLVHTQGQPMLTLGVKAL